MFTMGLLMFSLGFSDGPSTPNNQENRYQAVVGERGLVIIDTYTGDYILDSQVNYIGKMHWIKGNFQNSFDTGKDKTGR